MLRKLENRFAIYISGVDATLNFSSVDCSILRLRTQGICGNNPRLAQIHQRKVSGIANGQATAVQPQQFGRALGDTSQQGGKV